MAIFPCHRGPPSRPKLTLRRCFSGLADSESNRDTLSAVSILNYAHLGAAIKLKPRSNPLYYSVQSSTFHSDTTVKVVSDRASTGLVRNVLEEAPWAHRLNVVKTGNPLAKVLMLLPPPLLDHCEQPIDPCP